MHSARHEFNTPGPVVLDIQNNAGDVGIEALPIAQSLIVVTADNARSEAAVDETAVTMSPDGQPITVRGPKGGSASLTIRAQVPIGASVVISLGAGDIKVRGAVRDVTARTGSGDISVENASGEAQARTGSGDVAVGDVAGSVSAVTGSGDIAIGDVAGSASAVTGSGDVSLRSAARAESRSGSGDISIAVAAGDVSAAVGSGDIAIGRVSAGQVRAETASGDVSIGIAAGVVAKLDVTTVSGRIDSDLPVDEDAPDGEVVDIWLKSVNGDIRVRRVGG